MKALEKKKKSHPKGMNTEKKKLNSQATKQKYQKKKKTLSETKS